MTSQFPQSYNRFFKSIDEQIELLKSRGMLFRDESQAKHHLLNLNYYRLSGYWLPFKQSDDSFSRSHFPSGNADWCYTLPLRRDCERTYLFFSLRRVGARQKNLRTNEWKNKVKMNSDRLN